MGIVFEYEMTRSVGSHGCVHKVRKSACYKESHTGRETVLAI